MESVSSPLYCCSCKERTKFHVAANQSLNAPLLLCLLRAFWLLLCPTHTVAVTKSWSCATEKHHCCVAVFLPRSGGNLLLKFHPFTATKLTLPKKDVLCLEPSCFALPLSWNSTQTRFVVAKQLPGRAFGESKPHQIVEFCCCHGA